MNLKRWDRVFFLRLLPVGFLALLCLVFFWDVLWLPPDRILGGEDLTNLFLHWLRFSVSSMRQSQFPLWNPYLFSGAPFVANPQPALFYPPTWLALLMPINRALGLIAALHLWIAGAGMYAWLRSEEASTGGALFGAATFAFSGYFFVRVRGGHLGVVTTGAWLPLLLWFYNRTLEERSWVFALVGGLPVGLSILAGHTASFVYVVLGLTIYAAFHAWEEWQAEHSIQAISPPMLWVSVMLLVGLAVAAVQLLPMTELVMRSTRKATDYGFTSRFSWPPGYLLTLLVPNFFGEPTHTGYWGDGIYDESIFYIGVLPLLLSILGLKSQHRLRPFLLVTGLGALFLAFGKYGILHRLFYRFVPVFRTIRAPARANYLLTLATSAWAGLVLTNLQASSREERMVLLKPLSQSVLLSIIGCALLLTTAGFMAFAWGRDSNLAAGRLWHQANQIMLFLFFFLLSVGLLIYWRRASSHRSQIWLLAFGLVILDLWTFGNSVVEVRTMEENAYWRIAADTIPNPQSTRVLPWGLNEAHQNDNMAFGLHNIFGYDPLILQQYEKFISSRSDPRAHTYDLLNAGYLVTTAPQKFPDEPDALRLVIEKSGVYIYERTSALPKAWIASQIEVMDSTAILERIHQPSFAPREEALMEIDPQCENMNTSADGTVDIVSYENNQIKAQTQGGGGLLVFSEIYYPGWQATVDGQSTPLMRADYLLRAICVPDGEHQVVLSYNPLSLKVGLTITTLTVLLIFSVIGWGLFKSRARKEVITV